MRTHILLLIFGFVSVYCDRHDSTPSTRVKRDTSGALHIITNNAQPIHADVKQERDIKAIDKVLPPNDVGYELKSLRKSSPLTNKLELIRTISRVITLAALLMSAILEFYPMLQHLYYTVYSFMYLN